MHHMNVGSSFDEVDHCLKQFGEAMRFKLKMNQHKGNRNGWLRGEEETFIRLIEEEFKELKKALSDENRNKDAILCEAADMANLLMMLCDLCDGIRPYKSPVPLPDE